MGHCGLFEIVTLLIVDQWISRIVLVLVHVDTD